MKHCVRCLQAKPLDDFPRNRHKADGRHYYCRACLKADYQARREVIRKRQNEAHHRNRDRIHGQRRRAYLANDGRSYYRNWRRRNAERVREMNRRSRLSRPRDKARIRDWWRRNTARHRMYNAQRRAQKRLATGTITPAEWQAIQQAFAGHCAYCGRRPDKLTMDHDIPLIRGGCHSSSNIVPACRSCNSRKGRLTGEEFRRRLHQAPASLASSNSISVTRSANRP